MLLELHMLQNFAPSNLNRDDTGSPKDCEFGGYRRARISSQCLKRSIRREAGFTEFLGDGGGVRTRRLILEIANRLAGVSPAPESVVKVVSDVFREGGIERASTRRGDDAEKDTTKLILYMDGSAIDDMVGRLKDCWNALQRGDKTVKEEAVRELGEDLAKAVKAPDIALFGRMIEINPSTPFGKLQLGVDAACQVAHALSTNAVSLEFDFFTAVDDLKSPSDDPGAGMLGTVEFNSSCYYRYANIDLRQLLENLCGDTELARATVRAFLHAAVHAVPSGKQNSFAAQNPPSLVMGVVRDDGAWSLANAFVKPVRPNHDGDLIAESVAALDGYWGRLTGMYGETGISTRGVIVDGAYAGRLDTLAGAQQANCPALINLMTIAAYPARS